MEKYQIEQSIRIDLQSNEDAPVVMAKQFDHNMRVVAVEVWDGGRSYALPQGYVARVGVHKGDGTRVLNDCEAAAGGDTLIVYAVITQQMTAVKGEQRAEIQISGPDGQLRSGSFVLQIAAAEVGEDVIESLDEYKSIDAILAEVRQLKAAADQDAKAAAASATGAASSAAAAKSSETSAKASQTAAANSAAAAKASETAAAGSKTAAKASEDNALASKTAAASSASAASSSATAAKSSETAAAKSATAAAGSATAAKASETTATASKEAAAGSAAAAKVSEDNAVASKTAAAGSAAAAKSSETAAAASKMAAASSATAAKTSESAAAQSATAAAKSAEDAKIAAGGGVLKFNGRAGEVVPQAGDYTASQVGAATAAQGAKADGLVSGTQTAAKATTADRLATARKIGSADFDGSADITLAQMGVPNPNLLDNSDFSNPVNQRGLTTYPELYNQYSIDRWYVNGTVAIDSNISISGTAITVERGGTLFATKLDSMGFDYNGYYSLSLKINGKIVIIENFQVYKRPPGVLWANVPPIATIEEDIRFLFYEFDEDPNTPIYFAINSLMGTSFNIDWVKLEKGSIATPYVPKGYAVELMECMRYFQIVGSQTIIPPTSANVTIGTGNVVDAATAVIVIPISVPLRLVSPTVSMRGTFLLNWVNESSTGNYSVSNISFQSATNTIVTIKAKSQNMGLYFVRMQTAMSDSWIEISADL